jgi:hypothetical protein
LFFGKARRSQLFEIFCGGLMRDLEIGRDEFNPCMGVAEQVVEKALRLTRSPNVLRKSRFLNILAAGAGDMSMFFDSIDT